MGPIQQYLNGLQFKWAPNNNIDPGGHDVKPYLHKFVVKTFFVILFGPHPHLNRKRTQFPASPFFVCLFLCLHLLLNKKSTQITAKTFSFSFFKCPLTLGHNFHKECYIIKGATTKSRSGCHHP